jgi:HD-like signal output (HDOD) protein
MIKHITSKIDALPPLPKTLMQLEKFKRKSVQEPFELLAILQQDPLILSTLLKVANSAMFGFRHKVETPQKAIELIGINFTLSIAFGSAIKSTLNTTLDAYNLSPNQFIELANMSSNLLHKWVGRWNATLKDELLLPVFLQETGKFVISDIAKDMDRTQEFYNEIKKDFTKIPQIEKEYFEATSSQVTALIFEQWGLDDKLINIIKHIDDVKQVNNKHKQELQILNIIKILCNPIEPLSDKAIQIATDQAKQYNLNERSLRQAIEIMQDRILDAM